jgi:hypothetical protein
MLDLMNAEYIEYNEKHEMPNHTENLVVINNQQLVVTENQYVREENAIYLLIVEYYLLESHIFLAIMAN